VGDQDEVAERCAVIAAAVVGHGDLDRAVAAFDGLPAGLSARPELAAGLVEAIVGTGEKPGGFRSRALPGLLAVAEVDPPDTIGWRRTRVVAEVQCMAQRATEMRLGDPGAALDRLDHLAAEHADDHGLTTLLDSARVAMRLARTLQSGDDGDISRMSGDLVQFLSSLPPDVATGPQGELLTRMAGLLGAPREGDVKPAGTLRPDNAAGTLPPDNPACGAFDDMPADLGGFLGLGDDDAGRPSDDQLAALVVQATRPGLDAEERALLHLQAGMAALWLGRETDPCRVALGVEQHRAALELVGPDDPQRAFYLSTLATALLNRHQLAGATADLREAADLLGEARMRAGGPAHEQWQQINDMLGHARRLFGDRPGSHWAAVEGLRDTVWQMLVQPDLASAAAVVRYASDDAIGVARQCLAAGDPEAAITALDAGRGLSLFAAGGSGPPAQRLAEAGEPALADRWRAAAATRDPAALSPELRRDVMTVLASLEPALELLDPPGYAEIQQALTDLDADVLVYLMPGEGIRSGYAVLAPAAGPPSSMTLTSLTPHSAPDLDRYLAALALRELADTGDGPEKAPADDDLEARLDDVGRWAWDAAMCPLIECYLPRIPARDDRPPRIVLVPMGELARVPWQAARRPDGRYAVELIALSQAASARMLVRSATLPAVPLTPTGLIIGDPDTATIPAAAAGPDMGGPDMGGPDMASLDTAAPLPAARLEAYAIRQSFYRGARYLGRRPDGTVSRAGPGSADEVRTWLTSADPIQGAMLHLACHGFARSGGGRPNAFLLLAGGERLTARELLADATDRAISLVVLAACRTGLSLTCYDEAYGLATAFLAGGVRTVLSSQWCVPGSATSALMFMVHRNLRVLGRPAWAALRDAQLWMLDPDRVVPDDMPEPLRARIAGSDPGAAVAWAAFLHQGK
jgi:CHAT domain-containing protein